MLRPTTRLVKSPINPGESLGPPAPTVRKAPGKRFGRSRPRNGTLQEVEQKKDTTHAARHSTGTLTSILSFLLCRSAAIRRTKPNLV